MKRFRTLAALVLAAALALPAIGCQSGPSTAARPAPASGGHCPSCG